MRSEKFKKPGYILKFLFLLSVVSLIGIAINMLSLINSQQKEIVSSSFEFNRTFISAQLEFFESFRKDSANWDDKYTIEFLKTMMEAYDREPGVLARVLDKDLNLLNKPKELDKDFPEDFFSKENIHRNELVRRMQILPEGELHVNYLGEEVKLYYRAYPLQEKEIYLVVGVSGNIVAGKSIFTSKLILLLVLFLAVILTSSFIVTLEVLNTDRKISNGMKDLLNIIKIPKDETRD